MVGGGIGAVAIKFIKHPKPVYEWPVLAAMLGWVLFSLYWSAAATHAPARIAESRASRKIHEVLINVGYLLLLLPAAFPAKIPFVTARFLPDWTALKLAGLAVEAGSLALAVWARRTLGQNWSGPVEIKKDHQLIRNGPYRRLRHPIYTAVLGMAVGTSITIGATAGLIAIAIIVFAYIRKIRMEEARLREAFGGEYDEYRRETWGLVPGVRYSGWNDRTTTGT